MSQSPTFSKRCPCGQNVATTDSKYALAVTVAVTTLLEQPRRRAKSVTIYPCKRCINANSALIGTAVAVTLGKAVTQQVRELAAPRKGKHDSLAHRNTAANRRR